MMQLLRKLANEGRTIILVTHATSNIDLCDRLIFLGKGGNLCYLGTPEETLKFFNIKKGNFADVYLHLENVNTVIEEAERFKKSPDYQNNIEKRLITNSEVGKKQAPKQVKRSPLKQLQILAERYGKLIIRDKISLGLSLLTAPIGISLIKFAIDKQPFIPIEGDQTLAPLALRVLFVFTSACIWVGLSSSLQEIVKENIIYQRERLVNLNLISYLFSKIIMLGSLAVVQTLLITLVILLFFKSPDSELVPWFLGLFMANFLTLFSSISLGLMVSSAVKNASQANSALPLILIPQIIFSGVLFTMEGAGKFISWLMISRWSIGLYGTLVNINKLVPEPIPYYDTEIKPPFEGSPVYQSNSENLLLNIGILSLHSLIYLMVTYYLQKRKDII
jgi:putative ABC transport system ATP-binding protein